MCPFDGSNVLEYTYRHIGTGSWSLLDFAITSAGLGQPSVSILDHYSNLSDHHPISFDIVLNCEGKQSRPTPLGVEVGTPVRIRWTTEMISEYYSQIGASLSQYTFPLDVSVCSGTCPGDNHRGAILRAYEDLVDMMLSTASNLQATLKCARVAKPWWNSELS